MATAEKASFDLAQRVGLRSFEWVRFETSPAGPNSTDWRPFVRDLAAELKQRDIRLTAIAALYRNPLDPRQSEYARRCFRRAIEVAAEMGVRTVAGFFGGHVETELNERGGNLVYKPLKESLPQALVFWEPIARRAADQGIRLAFENCPQSPVLLPVMGYNFMSQPAHWEQLFNATGCDNIGLEWDPSHLICQQIDPVANLRKFGARVFHVHAKDAYINRPLLETYGICHPGVLEHRMPGLGQADWAQIIHTLLRVGYDSDLTIEGRHDPVYRDHPVSSSTSSPTPLSGCQLDETGLRIARDILQRYAP